MGSLKKRRKAKINKHKRRSVRRPDEGESGPGAEALRLRAALAEGDVDTARTLIGELSQDQISEVLYDQGVEGATSFLSATVQEKLADLHSPQFVLSGKPRVVSVAEVAEKCGPVYGPFSVFSFGPRPEGWGAAAAENRILSWLDQGMGLVGDQTVNVDDRYITALPLDEFEGALIAGPLDAVQIEELPEEQQVVKWQGRPLNMDCFDPRVFRTLFLEATRGHRELFWSYDFRANAAALEAVRYFKNHDQADQHADILLARATLAPDEEHREVVRQALKLDPTLKAWADWIEAWIDFPENMERTARLKDTDPMGSALLAAMQTQVDLKDSKPVSLDALEAYAPLRDNPASPYLSWILGKAIDGCLAEHLEGKAEIEDGGDPAPYAQAIRLGYRGEASFSWLMQAIKAGANDFVRLCLASGFKPVGRYFGGPYMNLLTTAANNGNLEAVQAFLEHGADPNEPSHYGGQSTLALGEEQSEFDTPWSQEIMDALRAARKGRA